MRKRLVLDALHHTISSHPLMPSFRPPTSSQPTQLCSTPPLSTHAKDPVRAHCPHFAAKSVCMRQKPHEVKNDHGLHSA